MTAFIDTNLFVYFIDAEATQKRLRAAELINRLYLANEAVISTQVLQEFYNTATKKFRLPSGQVMAAAREYARAQVVQMSQPIVFAAMQRHVGGLFSFWDALIVEAALAAKCQVLYSEDMQHGFVVDGLLTITNPFLSA